MAGGRAAAEAIAQIAALTRGKRRSRTGPAIYGAMPRVAPPIDNWPKRWKFGSPIMGCAQVAGIGGQMTKVHARLKTLRMSA